MMRIVGSSCGCCAPPCHWLAFELRRFGGSQPIQRDSTRFNLAQRGKTRAQNPLRCAGVAELFNSAVKCRGLNISDDRWWPPLFWIFGSAGFDSADGNRWMITSAKGSSCLANSSGKPIITVMLHCISLFVSHQQMTGSRNKSAYSSFQSSHFLLPERKRRSGTIETERTLRHHSLVSLESHHHRFDLAASPAQQVHARSMFTEQASRLHCTQY